MSQKPYRLSERRLKTAWEHLTSSIPGTTLRISNHPLAQQQCNRQAPNSWPLAVYKQPKTNSHRIHQQQHQFRSQQQKNSNSSNPSCPYKLLHYKSRHHRPHRDWQRAETLCKQPNNTNQQASRTTNSKFRYPSPRISRR